MYEESITSKIIQIGQEAVRNAQKENLEKGISNNYVIEGIHFRQESDGRIIFMHNNKRYTAESIPNESCKLSIKTDQEKELFRINLKSNDALQDLLSCHGEEEMYKFMLSQAKTQLESLGY